METEILTGGINKVWASDDIAIIVLFLCLIFSSMFNIILLKALLSSLPKVTDAVNNATLIVTKLYERISHD